MTNGNHSLEQIIKSRRSVRNFSTEIPPAEDLTKIIESAVYAPYGGATGIPLDELRKIFVFRQGSESMEAAKGIFLSQMRKNAKKLNRLLKFLPFLKPKMQTFANKVSGLAKGGSPALNTAAYFIVLAEKKGFPPVEKQSMAHALENMWLMATDLGLGFQLLSAIGTLSDNKDFLKLLDLKKGEYALDGCVIGYPKNSNEKIKEFDIEKFVTYKN
ncbi:MAG: nitroreductase family protein [Tannerella sp.]|jgi:nitroreductase|nr:nitroreductase family protein [Tannerella sp.]